MFLGVRAVTAKSFERIHFGNLVNFGIIPLVFCNATDYEKISQNTLFDLTASIQSHEKVTIKIGDDNIEFSLNLSERQRKTLAAGGLLNFTKANAG